MGQRPKNLTPHENLHHYWGAELRALRVARGLSLAELGRQLHCDPSYLAKIERAERPIPATLAQSCDQVLEARGGLVRLHALAESGADQTARTRGQKSAHVATEDAHVANQTGNLADRATFPDSDSLCGPWLNETSVALNRAWSLAILGDYHTAVQSFQNAITDLPSHRRRDRGVYLTRARTDPGRRPRGGARRHLRTWRL